MSAMTERCWCWIWQSGVLSVCLLRQCRPDIVLPFMDYLRDQGAVEESAALLVAWLDLLTGMASGQEGASTVFESLLITNAGKHLADCVCTDA